MGTQARRLALAVAVIAAGAALVLVAAGREWAAATVAGPLPARPAGRSGTDLLPWLPATAWVALAGAGAVVAARGRARRLVGALLLVAGAGVVAGAAWALAAGGAAGGWPVTCGVGGALVGAAGAVCAARGAGWPALGGRYERRVPADPRAQRPDQLWDALDRGEDPTA